MLNEVDPNGDWDDDDLEVTEAQESLLGMIDDMDAKQSDILRDCEYLEPAAECGF